MKKDFVIYTKMLEVAVWLFAKVNTFPKKQRFVLGQQIENSALQCLRLIIEANNLGKQRETALKKLDKLNIELEVLRSLLRMAFELNFITTKSLIFAISQIDEVGKMRGGWARHYSRNNESSKSAN